MDRSVVPPPWRPMLARWGVSGAPRGTDRVAGVWEASRSADRTPECAAEHSVQIKVPSTPMIQPPRSSSVTSWQSRPHSVQVPSSAVPIPHYGTACGAEISGPTLHGTLGGQQLVAAVECHYHSAG